MKEYMNDDFVKELEGENGEKRFKEWKAFQESHPGYDGYEEEMRNLEAKDPGAAEEFLKELEEEVAKDKKR